MLNLPEYILLIPAIPISIWVAWSDMKFMRIPNVACFALFISFLILAPLTYDLHEYGFRIAQGLAMLVLGFFATSIGLVGGGDSKFAAAMAPFIALTHIFPFVFLIGVLSFISVIIHKLVEITYGLCRLRLFKVNFVSRTKAEIRLFLEIPTIQEKINNQTCG